MTSVIPALSEEGWVGETNKILDLCLSYYITTDAQQTILYRDSIRSLPKTYHENNFSPDELRAQVQNDLEFILGQYFQQVDVRVRVKENPENDQEAFILLSASVMTEEGVRHELSKITQIVNSVSKQVLGYNNFGQAETAFRQMEFVP